MPGNEVHEDADGMVNAVLEAGRARTGPRHAAPRKALLTRLHVPTGKAIAMAAMPSAVLMGMGLTPQLASAQGLPKNPFRDGPCVSAPDKAQDDEQDAAKKQDKAQQDAKKDKKSAQDEKDAKAEDDSAQPKPSPSDSASGKDDSGSSGQDEPAPAPSQKDDGGSGGGGGLLGGVGDALGGLLGGGSSQQQESAPSQDESAQPSSSPSGAKDSGSTVKDTLEGVKDGVKGATDAADKTAAEAKKAAEKATKDAKEAAQKAADAKADSKKEQATDADGTKAFPCVEEKKVAGDAEQAPVTLPNQPWHLKSSLLALHGLDYKGVVNLRTANGSTKQALKFTAKSIDIHDLHQIVDGPNGLKYHVEAAKGSNSTIRNGQVTLYTEKLSGNMFGLIPITFDPEHPPPLNIPEVFFTNAEVTQAGQFGGTLTVPGLHSYQTGD